MAKEASIGDAKNKCARITKHASKKVQKAQVKLNGFWTIDYELFWLYIYMHGQFNLFDTNALIVFLFLAAPALTVWRAWILIGPSERSRSSHWRCSVQESTCARVSFLVKLQAWGLRPATSLRKRLWHRCFSMNFTKFLRTPFLKEYFRATASDGLG